MTIDEFLGYLRRTPRVWQVMPDGCIRTPGIPYTPGYNTVCKCPIVAVVMLYRLRGQIAPDIYGDIVYASDNEPDHDPMLRVRLLEACGLKP